MAAKKKAKGVYNISGKDFLSQHDVGSTHVGGDTVYQHGSQNAPVEPAVHHRSFSGQFALAIKIHRLGLRCFVERAIASVKNKIR